MNEIMLETLKVMIVDDHNLVVEAIKAMLEPFSQIEVVAYAKNAPEAEQLTEMHKPDVILMDISLPSMSGIDATRELKKKYPYVKVIMLSMHESGAYIVKAIQAGASGYLLKNIDKQELFDAICKVSEGDLYFSKVLPEEVVSAAINASLTESNEIAITKREKEILNLITQGFTNKEIAEKLSISKRTVDVHREHIMKKCNAKNSVELIHVVNELNLLA